MTGRRGRGRGRGSTTRQPRGGKKRKSQDQEQEPEPDLDDDDVGDVQSMDRRKRRKVVDADDDDDDFENDIANNSDQDNGLLAKSPILSPLMLPGAPLVAPAPLALPTPVVPGTSPAPASPTHPATPAATSAVSVPPTPGAPNSPKTPSAPPTPTVPPSAQVQDEEPAPPPQDDHDDTGDNDDEEETEYDPTDLSRQEDLSREEWEAGYVVPLKQLQDACVDEYDTEKFCVVEPEKIPDGTLKTLIEHWRSDQHKRPNHASVLEQRKMTDNNRVQAAYCGFETVGHLYYFLDTKCKLINCSL